MLCLDTKHFFMLNSQTMATLTTKSRLTFTRYSALLMLMVTLTIVAHSLVPSMYSPVVSQKQTVCISSLEAVDSAFMAGVGACKPPKHSYIDYSTFFSPKSFILSYNPDASKLLAYEPFLAHSQVYFEIIVPPDNQA